MYDTWIVIVQTHVRKSNIYAIYIESFIYVCTKTRTEKLYITSHQYLRILYPCFYTLLDRFVVMVIRLVVMYHKHHIICWCCVLLMMMMIILFPPYSSPYKENKQTNISSFVLRLRHNS